MWCVLNNLSKFDEKPEFILNLVEKWKELKDHDTLSSYLDLFLSVEKFYQEKIDFLKEECYKFYLKKILSERHKARVVDFPDFMYWQRLAICQEAVYLSNLVVSMHEKVYGRRFIEKCYSRRLQEVKKSLTK